MPKGKQSELSLLSSLILASTYFPTLAVSSALSGFTSLFGMEEVDPPQLLTPSINQLKR